MLSYENFKECDSEYRSAPFWSLNDKLEKEELLRQIREMKKVGMGGFFMHPRGGMKDEYMGKEYMEALRACIEEADKLGMKAWLYDEDRFPSGAAGGIVTSKKEKYRAKALELVRVNNGNIIKDDEVIRVFACDKDGQTVTGYRDVTSYKTEELQELCSELFVFRIVYTPKIHLWNMNSYTDLCYKEAVDEFISTTHEKYKAEFSEYFGGTIPGIFTDEPNFNVHAKNRYMLPWTYDFQTEFKKVKGYDLLENLPMLFFDTGNYKKIRFDYWDLISSMFVKSFSENIYNWCSENKLNFTGHYWEHGFPDPMHSGSTMPHYEFMQYPGIDMLFKPGAADSQVGNDYIVKEVSSVGNQLGKKRILSETYGASGWDLDFKTQKKVADWQFALGINLVCQHLVHYSLKGCRKRDFPLSFLDHQPWWDSYKILGDYIGRMSYVLGQGKYMADILVLHPSSSTWTEFEVLGENEKLDRIEASVKDLCKNLNELHYGYDLGDDVIMGRHGSVEGDKLVIGEMKYTTVILPHMVVLRNSTFKLLKKFASNGGNIVTTGEIPILLDGERSEELTKFFNSKYIMKLNGHGELEHELAKLNNERISIIGLDGNNTAKLYCHKRRIEGKILYFICNTDTDRSFRIELNLGSSGNVEEWDGQTGERKRVSVQEKGGQFYCTLEFNPVESHLLIADSVCEKIYIEETGIKKIDKLISLKNWQAQRKDYNALSLKLCQLEMEDGSWSKPADVLQLDSEVREKLKLEWRGIFWRQPWMFTDEDKSIMGSFKVRYPFCISEELRGELYAAVESPEEVKVFINGNEVEPLGTYYKDRAFAMYDIKRYSRQCENELVIFNPNYDINSGFEAVYIIGDFKVQGTGGDFSLSNEDYNMPLGDWTKKGYPYYSGTVEYKTYFDLEEGCSGRVLLSLKDIKCVSAKVVVNGCEAGTVAWEPYEVDISSYLKAGINEISVIVMNSLQNLLGPHNGKERDLITPGSFFLGEGDCWFVSSGFDGEGYIRIFS